jgi:hypothetical protein
MSEVNQKLDSLENEIGNLNSQYIKARAFQQETHTSYWTIVGVVGVIAVIITIIGVGFWLKTTKREPPTPKQSDAPHNTTVTTEEAEAIYQLTEHHYMDMTDPRMASN